MSVNTKSLNGNGLSINFNLNETHKNSRNKPKPLNIQTSSNTFNQTQKITKSIFRTTRSQINQITNENSAFHHFRAMIAQKNISIDEDLQRAKDLRMKYDAKLSKLKKKDNLICPSITMGMNSSNLSMLNKNMNKTSSNLNFFAVKQKTPPKRGTTLDDNLMLSPVQPKGRPSVAASIFKTQYRLERINSSNLNSGVSSSPKKIKKIKHGESLKIKGDLKKEFNNLLSASGAKNILQKMDSKRKDSNLNGNGKSLKSVKDLKNLVLHEKNKKSQNTQYTQYTQYSNHIKNTNIDSNRENSILDQELDFKSEADGLTQRIIDFQNESKIFNNNDENDNYRFKNDKNENDKQEVIVKSSSRSQKPEIFAGKNIFKSLDEDMSKLRKKTYKVKYDPEWYLRAKVPEIKLPKSIAEDGQLQFHLIDDELKVISENMHYFKSSCLNNSNLLRAFLSLDLHQQIKLNILVEETCGLMLEVANKILSDFSKYLEKILSMQPPHPSKISSKYVKYEDKTFIFNVGVFNEISAFLKSCHDVYSTLIRQVDDLVIPVKDLQIILQFLTRIRLNLSNLLYSCKGHMKIFKFDSNLVEIFTENFHEAEDNYTNHYDRKNKINEFRNNRKEIIEKIKNSFSFKKEEYNERMQRLNNVLFVNQKKDDDSFEIKKKKLGKQLFKSGGLNSKIVDKLLKYCNKDMKIQIVSERIMERHRQREEAEN